ncbi:MAG: hypothetical protein ACLPWF_04695 [Bryobacteraceae bacterium]|jgi:hypothetical protein
MVIRLHWQEVADIVTKQLNIPGLQLGEPRVMQRVPYGDDEEVENPIFEFPIVDAAKPADVPRSGPELLAVAAAEPPDVPF